MYPLTHSSVSYNYLYLMTTVMMWFVINLSSIVYWFSHGKNTLNDEFRTIRTSGYIYIYADVTKDDDVFNYCV